MAYLRNGAPSRAELHFTAQPIRRGDAVVEVLIDQCGLGIPLV